MQEIDRATLAFGKKNSQFMAKQMTLNIMSRTPYRTLHQCLSQIERKRQALKENIFKIKKDKVELKRLQDKVCDNVYDEELRQIEIEEKVSGIGDATLYIEGCLKEIALYQSTYKEIKQSNNLPDDWDEVDFEKAEGEHHIKQAFLQSMRDLIQTGNIGAGDQEYLEQVGVNPLTALVLCREYLQENEEKMQKGYLPTFDDLEDFLNKMADMFKDCPQRVAEIKGINRLVEDWYSYVSKPHDDI